VHQVASLHNLPIEDASDLRQQVRVPYVITMVQEGDFRKTDLAQLLQLAKFIETC
jgi:hypothetical protein